MELRIESVGEIHVAVVYNSTVNENCNWPSRWSYTHEARCGTVDAVILDTVSAGIMVYTCRIFI